jgi:predicted molibdopterin-dependent oxidoreductase YjgC
MGTSCDVTLFRTNGGQVRSVTTTSNLPTGMSVDANIRRVMKADIQNMHLSLLKAHGHLFGFYSRMLPSDHLELLVA